MKLTYPYVISNFSGTVEEKNVVIFLFSC